MASPMYYEEPYSCCPQVAVHPSLLLLYGGFATGGLFCWDLSTSK